MPLAALAVSILAVGNPAQSAPAPHPSALEWRPILQSGDSAPGAPGRKLERIDAGQRHLSWSPPRFDESGRLHVLAFLDGAPADQAAGRIYQWTPDEGLSLQPPAPFPNLDSGCEYGIEEFGLGKEGAYFLRVASVGDFQTCESTALLRPDDVGGWTETLQTPDGLSPDGRLGLGSTDILGTNRHSEALIRASEFSPCPLPGLCQLGSTSALYSVDPVGVQVIYRVGEPAPGLDEVASLASIPDYRFGPGLDGPNELGQIVVDVPLRVQGVNTPAIYRWDPSVGLELMALAGDPAPGIPGATLEWLASARVDDAGAITFWARLHEGPGVSETDDDTIWTLWPDGEMELRFRESESSGPVALPFFVNQQGDVALVTESPSRVLWGPDADGHLRIRAQEGDPLPAPGGTLDAFEVLFLSDAGELLIESTEKVAYYKIDESDVLSIVADGIQPVVPPKEAQVVRTHLTHDADLDRFALGVWSQVSQGPINSATILVPVPEPSAALGWLVSAAVLAVLRRRR